jgi:hypothetical protein
MKAFIYFTILFIAPQLCAQATAEAVVIQWNDLALDTIRERNTAPPVAARNLAILHLAIFDAVNSIARTHESYAFAGHAPASASRSAAAAAAGYHALSALYPDPEDQAVFLAFYEAQLAMIPERPPKRMGLEAGRAAAGAILELREDDGSDQAGSFFGGTEPGEWRPTVSFGGEVLPALAPWWGSVTPFAMAAGDQFRPPAPPPLNTPEYAGEFNEVKELGRDHSASRTADQTEMALFWGYGPRTATPPGHWNEIAQAVAVSERLALEQNARLFALLNMALADAGISCWEGKYRFNYWRPITAIAEAHLDGNSGTFPETEWWPLLETPPFPEYTSGHSTFSGAAAAVLVQFFGTDHIPFSVGSDDLPGVRRSYGSFSEAAWESGLSRIYGGIHFMSANLNGLDAGAGIGEWTFALYLRPKGNRSRK